MATKLGQTAVQTLAAGGTPQAVGTIRTRALTLQADPTNGGYIYIGSATMATTSGFALSAGQSMTINPPEDDKIVAANEIYWDGTTGYKLRVVYEEYDLA